MPSQLTPIQRARLSLEGLSVGDAFGERYIAAPALLARRGLRPGPWPYTDDTVMALGLVEVLARHERVDQDALAEAFAAAYRREPDRGYGGTAHVILRAISSGAHWREVSAAAFGGQGSMGNGAAMRVAPLGAYFADDLDRAALQARLSAEVTHTHPEGQAGAIAVAVAAAWAWSQRSGLGPRSGRQLLDAVLAHTPDGETRDGIRKAHSLSPRTSVEQAVYMLGNGSDVTAPDTVPFALWCAASALDSYEEAAWTTASGLGDIDTNCAIVGGIVVLATGVEGIPEPWRRLREPLPPPTPPAVSRQPSALGSPARAPAPGGRRRGGGADRRQPKLSHQPGGQWAPTRCAPTPAIAMRAAVGSGTQACRRVGGGGSSGRSRRRACLRPGACLRSTPVP